MKSVLLDDFAVNFACAACCVSFVNVDVHCQSVFGMNTADNVIKNQGALVRNDLDLNNFLIDNAKINAVLGSEVDVALSYDNALGKLNFACGAYELACAGACENAGLTNGSSDAESTSVGSGNFHLSLAAAGAEDGNTLESALGAYDVNTLEASILTGLRKILLVGELCALAEQNLKILSAYMYMASTGLDQNFILHGKLLLDKDFN